MIPHGNSIAERLLRCAPAASRDLAALIDGGPETELDKVLVELRDFVRKEKGLLQEPTPDQDYEPMLLRKQQLLEALRAAMDCYSHFHRPTIISNDAYFQYGERSAVICQHCVELMEKLLTESGWPHYDFPEIRADVIQDWRNGLNGLWRRIAAICRRSTI